MKNDLTSNKPNIIFIFADDLGYGDMSCYGATKIQTPNIDKLAENGVRFMDVHSSSAVCTPSRYSLLTGRYCWRTELKKWVISGYGAPLIEKERSTIATLLKENGYKTAAVGKWHLGLGWQLKNIEKSVEDYPRINLKINLDVDYSKPITDSPIDHGFDYFFGIAGSLDMPPYCYIENNRTVGIPKGDKQVYYNQQRHGPACPNWKDEEVDTTFTSKAIKFIVTHHKENPDKPFFLYFPTTSPHRPCDCQPDFVKGKSQAGDRGDMVVLFDWIVGEIKETIDRLGLAENTLFIITSDNGARATCSNGKDYGHKSCGNLKGQKADIWDGGHREPFIAVWPNKIIPNTINNDLICLSDIYALFSSILGKDIPNGETAEDSFDFIDSLMGKTSKKPKRETIIHHSGGGMFSFRKGKWKMIRGLGSGGFTHPQFKKKLPWNPEGQLYNLEEDILETKNLWKKHPEIVKELSKLLDESISQGYTRQS